MGFLPLGSNLCSDCIFSNNFSLIKMAFYDTYAGRTVDLRSILTTACLHCYSKTVERGDANPLWMETPWRRGIQLFVF